MQVPRLSGIGARFAPGRHCSWQRIAWGLTLAYLAGVSVYACLLWGTGDQWWVGTVLLFGPRWPILTPPALLGPLGLVFHRQSLPWLFGAMVVAVWLVMGLAVPWQRVSGWFSDTPDLTLRVVTYNCGETADEAVARMADALQPDILTLNEWHSERPLPDALTQRRHVGRAGGNVVLSRLPIEKIEELPADGLKTWEKRALRCQLRTAVGSIQVVCVHLQTPRGGLSEVRSSLWRGAEAVRRNTEERQLEAEVVSRFARGFSGPSIVAGDFNTPVESRIYHRYWSRWQNAYSQAGCGLGYTKFTRGWGVRIDHVLVSSHWRVTSAWVGPDLGGDHRPVVSELALRL